MSELIYTATFGEVEIHKLVNRTPKGYRVLSGKHDRQGVVFEIKQFSGWYRSEEKIYFQQRAFTKKSQAEAFALKQLISMEGFYNEKLKNILQLKSKLEQGVNK